MTDDERDEAEYAGAVQTQAEKLETQLRDTVQGLGGAQRALDTLMGPLYAIEWAEGSGPDIGYHLDVAARSIRAALAIHRQALAATFPKED